jgi:hypothetical protein
MLDRSKNLSAEGVNHHMRRLAAWPLLALVMGPLGQAPSQPRAKVDVSKLGPQVGQRVPAFSLKDQTGKIRTLESIMGTKGAMLVFLRSADW